MRRRGSVSSGRRHYLSCSCDFPVYKDFPIYKDTPFYKGDFLASKDVPMDNDFPFHRCHARLKFMRFESSGAVGMPYI